MAYYPRIHEEVQRLIRELREPPPPNAQYELVSAGATAIQQTEFLNTTEMGPFIWCGLSSSFTGTPTVSLYADGRQLVQGAEAATSVAPEVGVQSSVSLTGGTPLSDILPAPVVVRGRLLVKSMSAAGRVADKVLLSGFHVSERVAREIQRRGEAMWAVLALPAAGGEVPFSPNQWCRFDHFAVRDNTPTAAKFRLRFGTHELWPLGLTQLATAPTKIDGAGSGDLDITVSPGTRVAINGQNPSAAVNLELAGRCWYTGVAPQ